MIPKHEVTALINAFETLREVEKDLGELGDNLDYDFPGSSKLSLKEKAEHLTVRRSSMLRYIKFMKEKVANDT